MDALVILGAGGHARVLIDLCSLARVPVRGILDPSSPVGARIDGAEVLGGDDLLVEPVLADADGLAFVVGTALPAAHGRLARRLDELGLKCATLVHPSATVASGVVLAPGAVVMASATIQTGVTVGRHAVLNTRCAVDHDCVVGARAQVSPGAVLAGSVTLADDAFVGSGATVLPGRTVGEGAIVGAGATVVQDVLPGVTVTGSPARPR